MIEVKKIKTQWRAVEFDASAGSDSYDEVNELFEWAGVRGRGIMNSLDEYMPSIEVPMKKPSYPGETESVYVKHGGWIVASSRGKVEVLTADEFNERFEDK